MYRIGELAQQTGVSRDALRFYEPEEGVTILCTDSISQTVAKQVVKSCRARRRIWPRAAPAATRHQNPGRCRAYST